MANKITTVLDLDAKGFTSTLKGIGKSVGEADGLMGKLKAGSKATFDGLKQYSAEAALGASVALAAFAVKSVAAFQQVALEAGKFSDATGLAVEDASRWLEVSGDLGIGADVIEGSVRKFNKAVADGKPSIEEYGVQVVRTKDGIVDANATFINAIATIGAIEDPTLKAKAAQELFGRSYGEVAELMGMSADELKKKLGAVSDEKVITEDELKKARAMRELIDRVRDAYEDFVLRVGEGIASMAPQFDGLIDRIKGVAGALEGANEKTQDLTGSGLPKWIGALSDQFVTLDNAQKGWSRTFDENSGVMERGFGVMEFGVGVIPVVGEAFDSLGDKIFHHTKAVDEATLALIAENQAAMEATHGVHHLADAADSEGAPALHTFSDAALTAAKSTREAKAATVEFNDQLDKLHGKLDQREAVRSFEEAMIAYRAATTHSEEETDAFIGKLADTVVALDSIPEETKTKMIAELDQGSIDLVESRLAFLARGRNVVINSQIVGADLNNAKEGRGAPGFAQGGTVPGRVGAPMLAMVHGGEQVIPAGGGSVNVYLQGQGRSMGDRQLAYMNGGLINAQVRGARRRP